MPHCCELPTDGLDLNTREIGTTALIVFSASSKSAAGGQPTTAQLLIRHLSKVKSQRDLLRHRCKLGRSQKRARKSFPPSVCFSKQLMQSVLTKRHCTNVTLRSNSPVRYKEQTLRELCVHRGERAPFPHGRSRRSPASAVKPIRYAHSHIGCAFHTCLCSNPTSSR